MTKIEMNYLLIYIGGAVIAAVISVIIRLIKIVKGFKEDEKIAKKYYEETLNSN